MALHQPKIRRVAAPRPEASPPSATADQPARPALVTLGPDQLRRCTFRRLTVVGRARRGATASYQVECLYAGRELSVALGDLSDARRACDRCGNPGIFRADAD